MTLLVLLNEHIIKNVSKMQTASEINYPKKYYLIAVIMNILQAIKLNVYKNDNNKNNNSQALSKIRISFQ